MGRKTQKTEKEKVHRSKSSLLLYLLFFVLVFYLLVSFITTQLEMGQKKRELAELRQAVQSIKVENEELAQLLTGEDDSAFMERIAREKLGYVAPDEYVYIDSAGS